MIPKFKQLAIIRKGVRGELSKCQEELEELRDADNQHNRWHVAVEAADLINSTYTFVWRKYRIPFFVVILVALMTSLYKPTLRWLRSTRFGKGTSSSPSPSDEKRWSWPRRDTDFGA